ncbi:MAG: hypothetical protein J7M18_00490 [Candidatus Eremiobacteraeota bacterium]|nr:hypothetical protein [Candidatus Eremiobacteraeota bacterium]
MKIDKLGQISSAKQEPDIPRVKAKDEKKKGEEVKASRETITLSSSAARDLKKTKKTKKSGKPETSKPKVPEKKKWTVMIYFAADNDLEPYEVKNLLDLEKVGSSKDVNIIAQIDRGSTPTPRYGGNPDVTRYYVLKDKLVNEKIDSRELSHLGKMNSSDPEVLKDFLVWGMKNYPAENYLIILNDHGAGFAGALQDVEHKGFMSLPDMKKAFKEAEKEAGVSKDNIILGFDACLMGQAEVAYELRNVANIMIASEEAIGGTGWPYAGILSGNKFDKIKNTYTGQEALRKMAEHIIDETEKTQYATFTMSAVDLSKMTKIKHAIDDLGKALLRTNEPIRRMRRVIQLAQHYTAGFEEKPYSSMRDIYDIADRINRSTVISDKKLKSAAKEVMKAIEEAIIKEQHKKEDVGNSHGLSIYAPVHSGGYDNFKYHELDLAKDTSWDEAMIRFTGKPTKPKPGAEWTFSPPKGKGRMGRLK